MIARTLSSSLSLMLLVPVIVLSVALNSAVIANDSPVPWEVSGVRLGDAPAAVVKALGPPFKSSPETFTYGESGQGPTIVGFRKHKVSSVLCGTTLGRNGKVLLKLGATEADIFRVLGKADAMDSGKDLKQYFYFGGRLRIWLDQTGIIAFYLRKLPMGI